jgi:exopolyphosphatase / guanosine-5'-triphosphate,3'-diphosphate pyrophosphatase
LDKWITFLLSCPKFKVAPVDAPLPDIIFFQENPLKVGNRSLEKIASIDIGSNTLRLLIAEKTGGRLQALFRDREIVRLGRSFFPSRFLSSSAVEAAVKVLKRFKIRTEQEGVTKLSAIGTGVLREAENVLFFLKKVREETGVSVKIISGVEEAGFMAKGVLSIFPSIHGKTIIFDIGGGSTELVFINNGQMEERISMPLGVVGLTEKFLRTDPPKSSDLDSLTIHCRNILRKNSAKNDKIERLIGTAGTVTTLAAMAGKLFDYDPEQINRTVLTKEYLIELSKKILAASLEKRSRLPGLEPGRADIICAGILLVLEIMDHFSQGVLLVSDAGLLEGMILDEPFGVYRSVFGEKRSLNRQVLK